MPEEICCVCGAFAEGVRFRVVSCQPCAAFFRRSIAENKEYICRNSSTCKIDQKHRNQCRACRLKKCFIAGMRMELVNDTKLKSSNLCSWNSSSLPSTSDSIDLLGSGYESFAQAQKSLFKLHFVASKEQFLNTELEFQPITGVHHNLMEKGNASLIATFLMERFPTFKELPQEDKQKIFGAIAARFNQFHRCLLTIRLLDDDSDEKVVLHYGFYSSPKTIHLIYGDEPIPNKEEFVELVYPFAKIMRELSMKLKNLELSKNEIGGIFGLIYYSQMEKNHLWTPEAVVSRNSILKQLHHETVGKHGFEQGGVKYGQIVGLVFDVENVWSSFSNVRILRKLITKGGYDIFMLEDDSVLK